MTSYKTCLGNSNQKLIQCSSNLLGLVMLDIVARFKNRHDLVVFEGSMPFCVELDITDSDALARCIWAKRQAPADCLASA
jgi:hypothetical protein